MDFIAAHTTPLVISQGNLESVKELPHDEGAFHTTVFTNRILGKISEASPRCKVMKGIVPPQYIYPTAGHKQWLKDDMKWTLKDEKAYMKTSKKARRTK